MPHQGKGSKPVAQRSWYRQGKPSRGQGWTLAGFLGVGHSREIVCRNTRATRRLDAGSAGDRSSSRRVFRKMFQYAPDSPRSRGLQQKNSLLKHTRHPASRRWRCWRQVVESFTRCFSTPSDSSIELSLNHLTEVTICNIPKMLFYCCHSSGGTLSLAVESA